MAKSLKTTTVKGGAIRRDAASGRVVDVRTAKAVSKASNKSAKAVASASERRSAALKRLADR